MNRMNSFDSPLLNFYFDLFKKFCGFWQIFFAPNFIHELIRITVDLIHYKPWQERVLLHLINIFGYKIFDLFKQRGIGIEYGIDLRKKFLGFGKEYNFKQFVFILEIIMQ